MFTTAHTPLRDTLTAVAATAICTAVSLAAIDSPARAATTNSSFISKVESQLNNDSWVATDKSGVATVAIRVDAEGRVISAGLVGSTGSTTLDREALRTAKAVTYPKSARGHNVAVVLKFGDAKLPAKAESAALVNRYVNARGEALADQTPAPNAG